VQEAREVLGLPFSAQEALGRLGHFLA